MSMAGVGAALRDEVRALAAWLREPALWALLLLGVAAWSLAYGAPYTQQLDFGGNRATHKRTFDAPYLSSSFYEPEPDRANWWADGQPLAYRWTKPEADVRFPGIGGGRWLVSLTAFGQPGDAPTAVQWTSGGTASGTLALSPSPRTYHLLVDAPNGDLALHFSTPPLRTATDTRPLGFVAYRLLAVPLDGASIPALGQLGWLAAFVVLSYGLARRLGVGKRVTIIGGAVAVLLLAALLARWRMPLTIFTPTLALVALGTYTGALLLLRVPVDRWASAATPAPASHEAQWAWAVGLVAVALVIRLVGVLHPHTIFSDLGLNVNNQLGLYRGDVLITEGLPSEAGGGDAPYPPGQYLVLAPLQLLFPTSRNATELLLIIGNAVWDSLAVGALWFLLRRAGAGGAAALLGAALYLLAPPLLHSFSVGELANMFGQGLILPLVVALVVAGERLREPRVWGVLLALLALALLGHLGITISLVLLLVTLTAVWLGSPAQRRVLPQWVLLGAVAAALVGALYYSSFAYLLAARTNISSTIAPQETTLLGTLWGALTRTEGIHQLAFVLGAAGLALLFVQRGAETAARRLLRLLLLAWGVAALLSLGLLIFANQGVRWQHFLYPALCLASGPTLAAFARRGRAGKLFVVALLGLVLASGVALWAGQLIHYLH